MRLYEEEAQGSTALRRYLQGGPRCPVTYHVRVAELKETAQVTSPPLPTTFEREGLTPRPLSPFRARRSRDPVSHTSQPLSLS